MAESKSQASMPMSRVDIQSIAANVTNCRINLHGTSDMIQTIIHKRSCQDLENMIKDGWNVNEELVITECDCECSRTGVGSNVSVTSSVYRSTALQEACRHVWGDGVKLLIKAGAKVNLCPGVLGPLTIAVSCTTRTEEQSDMIKLLLQNGADPNGKVDSEVDAPLIFAIRESAQKGLNAHIVEILLESGADPNLAKRGNSPAGCRCPLSLTVECLARSLRDLNSQSHQNREQTFIESQRSVTKRVNAAILESLLKYGANINSNFGLDGPLLHRFVGRFGDFSGGFHELLPEHLELFYRYGGDIDLRDKYIGSALECCIRECGITQNIRWLIRHGADTRGLEFNIFKNQFIQEHTRPKRTSPYFPRVLLSRTPEVLLECGMKVPSNLHLHLSEIQRLIQDFMQKGDNADDKQLLADVESHWKSIFQKEELHQCRETNGHIGLSQEQRRQQVKDLEEFSDESLYKYPEDVCNPNPSAQWSYSLDMVSKTLVYLTQPRSLLWWCRCCVRRSLLSLHPSVIKSLPGPALLKRIVLCHNV